MRKLVLSLLAAVALCAPASAQQWKVYEEESISLDYRNAADTSTLLSVACGSDHADVTVPIDPGVKPPAQAPQLQVTAAAGPYALALQWDVCGRDSLTCTDRPTGQVSTYFIRTKDKRLALRFAQATAVSIDAPGALLSAKADKAAFARFAALCAKQ
jgi:hypothetical protein